MARVFRYSCLLAALLGLSAAAAAADLFPVNVAIHVESEVSHDHRVFRFLGIPVRRTEGKKGQPIGEVARIAAEHGVDALILSDRAYGTVSWGITPFSRIFRVTMEQGSVASYGPERYLDEIRRAADDTGVVIVPGVEHVPYYRWRGNPFRGLELAHAYEHMILAGLDTPEALAGIPNTAGGFGRWRLSWTVLLNGVFAGLFLLGFLVMRSKVSRARLWGGLLIGVAALAMLDSAPFLPRQVSPYHRPTRYPPDIVAQYAAQQDALILWAHPSARPGTLPERLAESTGVAVDVRPYPEVLTRTRFYHGFAAFNAGIAPARPGREWDVALLQYISGRRPRPVWAVSEGQYAGHSPPDGIRGALTVAWVRERSQEAILDALKRGRCYATRGHTSRDLWVVDYRMETGEIQAQSGEILRTVADSARLVLRLRTAGDARRAARDLEAVVVVDGRPQTVGFRAAGDGLLVANVIIPMPAPPDISYVRTLVCHSEEPILALNPIFLVPETPTGGR